MASNHLRTALFILMGVSLFSACDHGAQLEDLSDDDDSPHQDELSPMASIASTTFLMGCSSMIHGCDPMIDAPPQEINLAAFAIDIREVTVKEYAKCVAASACTPIQVHADCFEGPCAPFQEQDYPVNLVKASQADAFCKWAGKRLPSEAEWEHAGRGADGRRFPWGNDPLPTCPSVHIPAGEDNANPGCGTNTGAPVGSHPADISSYGVLDLEGSVREWTADQSGTGYRVRGLGWLEGDEVHAPLFRRVTSWGEGIADAGTGFRCAKSL